MERAKKLKILIGTGPTREYLDPVRFISNPSTGRMGFLIASECMKKGHEVTVVSGPTHLAPPPGAKCIRVETAREMKRTILDEFTGTDIFIMSAAVSDWRPEKKAKGKIKNKSSWQLRLVPNPDILQAAGRLKKPGQKTVGFALETSSMLKNAERKLKDKKLDLIVADSPEFFGTAAKASMVAFMDRKGSIRKQGKLTKRQTARKIVSMLEEL